MSEADRVKASVKADLAEFVGRWERHGRRGACLGIVGHVRCAGEPGSGDVEYDGRIDDVGFFADCGPAHVVITGNHDDWLIGRKP